MLQKISQTIFQGASWQQPVIKAGLERVIEPAYSIKGRKVSNAETTEFGQDHVIARKA